MVAIQTATSTTMKTNAMHAMKPAKPQQVALSFDAEMYKKLFPAEYMRKCLESGVRPDARAPDAARAVHIQTNVVHTAASSSLVKIGKTSVVAAIKLAVGLPAVSTPDQGEIGTYACVCRCGATCDPNCVEWPCVRSDTSMPCYHTAIQVHLTPLCSTRFSLGRPSEEAQSIGSQLTNIVIGYEQTWTHVLWRRLLNTICALHSLTLSHARLCVVTSRQLARRRDVGLEHREGQVGVEAPHRRPVRRPRRERARRGADGDPRSAQDAQIAGRVHW